MCFLIFQTRLCIDSMHVKKDISYRLTKMFHNIPYKTNEMIVLKHF